MLSLEQTISKASIVLVDKRRLGSVKPFQSSNAEISVKPMKTFETQSNKLMATSP